MPRSKANALFKSILILTQVERMRMAKNGGLQQSQNDKIAKLTNLRAIYASLGDSFFVKNLFLIIRAS